MRVSYSHGNVQDDGEIAMIQVIARVHFSQVFLFIFQSFFTPLFVSDDESLQFLVTCEMISVCLIDTGMD